MFAEVGTASNNESIRYIALIQWVKNTQMMMQN